MALNLTTLIPELLALLIGLVLHEFAHAYVGHQLGDTTAQREGRLTLNPLAHIDPITTLLVPLLLYLAGLPIFAAARPVPFNPWALRGGRWGAAAVAAAGPLTNLLIAILCGLWLHLLSSSAFAYELLGSIVIVNIGLGIFNLIPLPPLDGSRVLYAVAPPSLREVMDRIESAGLVVIFGFVLLMSLTPLGQVIGSIIQSVASVLLPHSSLNI